ncbi:hypothetical protein AX17_002648 [Amanita inopinata Kibby_2008]|nr:hypothetical protein AX17_002648 [Amanita inopinata Kibby_2008]
MESLPSIKAIVNGPSQPNSPLAVALSILFEHSPILQSLLEPELASALKDGPEISSYSDLIHASLTHIQGWEREHQSQFISGHPHIGEVGNLSNLSAKEQGARGTAATPPEILARLAHLNACYERIYPGLRYITFVNGRSREAIVEEMEDKLGLEHSLSVNSPASDELKPVDTNSEAWSSELIRAVQDVGRIAQSRLTTLGVE